MIVTKILFLLIVLNLTEFYCQISSKSPNQSDLINIDSKLELFTDFYLIDTLINTELKLHHPIDRGKVLLFDKPWEGQFSGYCTVIDNGEKFQMFYRGLSSAGKDGREDESTCYAESDDGINWHKPNLCIYDYDGNKNNNVILSKAAPVTHNFSPFLDSREGIDPNYRYKALGGTEKSGLIAYVSPDGINWKKLQEDPVFTKGKFDSQNISFWSESEQLYVCYFRTWTKINYKGYRSVSRTTSPDFLNWSEPEQMDFGDTPHEHIYTNQTSPYYRAPHIYLSIAARFMPGRQILSEKDAAKLNVNPKYFKDCSDAVLMTSRGGNKYDRTFLEAFIRPGIGLQNWVSRSNYPVLNIVETGPEEMSIYVNQDYAQPTAHIRRYSLRIDGFVSVNAAYARGEMITKPFIFSGDSLFINFSTSAAGSIRIEIQDGNGFPLNGYQMNDCDEIIGNEIKKLVTWKGKSRLNTLSGYLIKLRFLMKDSDLYSIKFE